MDQTEDLVVGSIVIVGYSMRIMDQFIHSLIR